MASLYRNAAGRCHIPPAAARLRSPISPTPLGRRAASIATVRCIRPYSRKPRGRVASSAASTTGASASAAPSTAAGPERRRRRCASSAAKVYVAAIVVLIAILRHGATAPVWRGCPRSIGVDRRTVERWRTGGVTAFTATPFWRIARAPFMPPVDHDRLPVALIERFTGDDADPLIALLRFLGPITGGAACTLDNGRSTPAEDARRQQTAAVLPSVAARYPRSAGMPDSRSRQGHQRVHERWAHLRFCRHRLLLAAPPAKGELRAAIDRSGRRTWQHPTTGEPVRFGFSTIERWYYRALEGAHRSGRRAPPQGARQCRAAAHDQRRRAPRRARAIRRPQGLERPAPSRQPRRAGRDASPSSSRCRPIRRCAAS